MRMYEDVTENIQNKQKTCQNRKRLVKKKMYARVWHINKELYNRLAQKNRITPTRLAHKKNNGIIPKR